MCKDEGTIGGDGLAETACFVIGGKRWVLPVVWLGGKERCFREFTSAWEEAESRTLDKPMASLSTCHLELVVWDGNLVKSQHNT